MQKKFFVHFLIFHNKLLQFSVVHSVQQINHNSVRLINTFHSGSKSLQQQNKTKFFAFDHTMYIPQNLHICNYSTCYYVTADICPEPTASTIHESLLSLLHVGDKFRIHIQNEQKAEFYECTALLLWYKLNLIFCIATNKVR